MPPYIPLPGISNQCMSLVGTKDMHAIRKGGNMSIERSLERSEFVKLFNGIARHRHRYEVFRDFVTMAAISLHNSFAKDKRLEEEYLGIVGRYEREEVEAFCKLLAYLVILLDTEPRDVLGSLYMELELGSTHVGQFFTPSEVSELMARMIYGDSLREIHEDFVTVSEPACGAGGMVLAFAKVMISSGHNPSEKLWVQCQDIDRLAALMCYLQLALWNIPGVVVVGNTLALEAREVFYTPAHHLGFWSVKLQRRTELASALPSKSDTLSVLEEPKIILPSPLKPSGSVQFDFGF